MKGSKLFQGGLLDTPWSVSMRRCGGLGTSCVRLEGILLALRRADEDLENHSTIWKQIRKVVELIQGTFIFQALLVPSPIACKLRTMACAMEVGEFGGRSPPTRIKCAREGARFDSSLYIYIYIYI